MWKVALCKYAVGREGGLWEGQPHWVILARSTPSCNYNLAAAHT